MSRIGIITFEFNYNYGAILQATALSEILKREGHDVEIVNRGWGITPPLSMCNVLKINKIASAVIGYCFTNRNLNEFKYKHWHLSSKVESDENIIGCLKKYDVIICGSDQIWNSSCIPVQGLYYFAIHADPNNQKLVAYAPSFGHDRFDANESIVQLLAEHLSRFKAISVRENDGLDICRDKFGLNNVVRVADPTMLLTADDYRRIAKCKKTEERKTLAYYLLDPTEDKMRAIAEMAERLDLDPVNIYHRERRGKSVLSRLLSLKYLPVENWLKQLSEAAFVMTDSFHGSVFSIIFNRQFITFANHKRGNSRFNSLFSTFGLEDRLINSSEICEIKTIDYHKINEILNLERSRSIEFIRNALQ